MIHNQLFNPESIVVVGASNDLGKPGGRVLKNLLTHAFDGRLFVVNSKEDSVQGVASFASCTLLPDVDLAFIAIASPYVEEAVRILAYEKHCKVFIVFSSGFGEIGDEGKVIEQNIAQIVNSSGGTLIGPNCIGLITKKYKGVFAGPIPSFDPHGCECVSASGAVMVFILEQALARGLRFSNIISVGNCAQVGIEEILEFWDQTFDELNSSRIKLLYLEEIRNPDKFLKHARSLVLKGCRIAAIKAGSTEDGSRAVSSHTGSLAGSDMAVAALFRKAGIVRCYSRVELVYVAGIFMHKPLLGKRIAIITHAGGPGVMLTDILIKGGMNVPQLSGPSADKLKKQLFPGSSVSNPIDFLATGTAEQLGIILDTIDDDFDEIDGSVVVFGTTGMWSVNNVYEVLHQKMNTCKKPIFPILPSVMQAAEEVSHFQSHGRVNFRDEVSFGYVLSRVSRTRKPYAIESVPLVNHKLIKSCIENSSNGYLTIEEVETLMKLTNIPSAAQRVVHSEDETKLAVEELGFPLVMKVVGPLHKSDVGGVVLNILSEEDAITTFKRLISIADVQAVLVQQMIDGHEIFIGAKKEGAFGHLILVGLGGIFVEVFKDVAAGLAPLSREECTSMIHHLKSYPILSGARGLEPINETLLENVLLNVSALLISAPEITEMDINPLKATTSKILAADVRICVAK